MVSLILDEKKRCVGLDLRPSIEMPTIWQLSIVLLLVGGPLAVEGYYFATLGFWPILLSTYATIVLFAYAMLRGFWRTRAREMVKLVGDELAVEKGHYRMEARHSVQRAWAQVILREADGEWAHSRLVVRAHGREIEIGAFLLDRERQELARTLRNWVGPSACAELELAA